MHAPAAVLLIEGVLQEPQCGLAFRLVAGDLRQVGEEQRLADRSSAAIPSTRSMAVVRARPSSSDNQPPCSSGSAGTTGYSIGDRVVQTYVLGGVLPPTTSFCSLLVSWRGVSRRKVNLLLRLAFDVFFILVLSRSCDVSTLNGQLPEYALLMGPSWRSASGYRASSPLRTSAVHRGPLAPADLIGNAGTASQAPSRSGTARRRRYCSEQARRLREEPAHTHRRRQRLVP